MTGSGCPGAALLDGMAVTFLGKPPYVGEEKLKGSLLKGCFDKSVRVDLPVPLPVPQPTHHPLPIFPHFLEECHTPPRLPT